MPEADGKQMAVTKVLQNRTTSLPEPFRNSERVEPGDKVEWRVIDGEWVVRPIEGCEE